MIQGYPSGPPGSYPPFGPTPTDQYNRGPPPPQQQQHEGYGPTGSYGSSYPPPPGPPGRPMYPSYGTGPDGSAQAPPHGGYSPQSQQPPTSQVGSTSTQGSAPSSNSVSGPPSGADDASQRYMGSMHGTPGGPPPPQTPGGYPPIPSMGRSPYQPPPGASGSALPQQGQPPPNGYPSQDYYHQQTDQVYSQGFPLRQLCANSVFVYVCLLISVLGWRFYFCCHYCYCCLTNF